MPIYLLMALSLIKIRKNFGYVDCRIVYILFSNNANVYSVCWKLECIVGQYFCYNQFYFFIYEIIERNSYKELDNIDVIDYLFFLYTLFFCIKFNNSLFDLFSIYFKDKELVKNMVNVCCSGYFSLFAMDSYCI